MSQQQPPQWQHPPYYQQPPQWQYPPYYQQPPAPQPRRSGVWVTGLIFTISGLIGTLFSIVLMLIGIGWCLIPFALMALVAGIVMLIVG